MDTRTLLLKHLVPGLGDIIALIMFLSPLNAVQRAARQKALGVRGAPGPACRAPPPAPPCRTHNPATHPAMPPPSLPRPQPLNPLPMSAMMGNCGSWLVYACLTRDPYVLIPNFAGLLLAVYMSFTCYGLADDTASAVPAPPQADPVA
jgi:hypothetical protein